MSTALNQATAIVLHPPVFIRLFRGFTFPAIVSTRHQIGERYYRNALIGRMVFYAACLPLPILPYAPVVIASILVGLAAGVWYIRCDLQSRREIKLRKASGVRIHSFSPGVPRFGLPDDERTSTVVIPTRLILLGVICSPVSLILGMYMLWAGIGLYTEAAWRRRTAREAELDMMDTQLGSSIPQPTAATHEQAKPLARRERSASGNPLAGFENIISPNP